MNSKIINIKNMTKKIKNLKKKNFKIGLCHGVFDLLHYGHINHFNKAKNNCDFLIVSITSDKFVNKGFGRPAFNQKIRMESISALETVNNVVLSDFPSAEKMIKFIKPDIYFKGSDYKNPKKDISGKIQIETNLVRKIGGKVVFTDEPSSSSSHLINKYFNSFGKEQNKYLNVLKKRHNLNDVIKFSER